VGVAFSGCEAAFFVRHERLMAPWLEQATERAGADLVSPLRAGEPPRAGELASQLFTYAFGFAVSRVYAERGVEPVLTAGHSMGLYAALAAAGAVGFEAGLGITEAAYRVALARCPSGSYDLAAVVGFQRAEIEQMLADERFGSLRLVNSNNATSKILAGPRQALCAFVTEAEARGALKALLLGVDLPYHHPDLLAGVPAELETYLRTLAWSVPRCPVVSSIDQRLLRDVEGLIELTSRNVATPIDWQLVVEAMAREGIDLVLECGAGLSLTQNARLIDPSPRFLSLKHAEPRVGG